MYLIIGKHSLLLQHCQDFPLQAESADSVPTPQAPAHISLGINLRNTISVVLSANSEPGCAEMPWAGLRGTRVPF